MSFARGGVIENPPFVVPVEIDRELEELTPLFTGIAIDIIERNSGKNQARALFRQLMEQDERTFGQLVQTIADIAGYYILADDIPNSRVLSVLADVGQLVVNGFLGQAVEQFQQEFGPYVSAEMANDVRNYQEDLVRELRKIQGNRGYGGGFNSPSRGYGRGRDDRGGGRGGWQPSRGYRGGRDDRGGRGGFGGGRQSRWDEDYVEDDRGGRFGRDPEPRTQWGTRRRGGPTIWDDGGSAPRRRMDVSDERRTPVRAARDFRAEAEAEGRERVSTPAEPQRSVRRRVEAPSPEATIVGNNTFVPAADNKLWPKVINRERVWDWILTETGEQIRPAHQSDWKVSFDPSSPGTPWYNPQTHILFHFRSPDGSKVWEQPIARNETMGYLDHELDPALRKRAEDEYRASQQNVQRAWKLVESLTPEPDKPLATADIVDGEPQAKEVVVSSPTQYMLTLSLDEAIKKAGVKRKLEDPEAMKKPYETYVDRVVLTTVVNPDFDFLDRVSNASDFKELVTLLTELPSGSELKQSINTRLTEGVNHTLQYNLGLKGWTIDSFEDDIGDLLQALRSDFGNALADCLAENAIEIIAKSLSYFSQEELKSEQLQKLLELPEDTSVLVWRERSSTTILPVSSKDFMLPKEGGMVVTATTAPDFHRTITSIFNRTMDIPQVYHDRYLMTNDGRLYQLARGYLNDGSILIYDRTQDL